MALTLNQLRAFQTVVAAGSITRAAQRLRLSQPAVSKQLGELENHLGIVLVDRRARGIQITAAGRVFLPHVQRLFQEEAAAEQAVSELLGLTRGQLSVGASTTIGNYLVPEFFGQLREAYPQIGLELQIGNSATVEQMVLDGSVDVGLSEGLVTSPELESEVFASDEMVVIASPEHAAASATSVTPAELAALPFIVRERGSGSREVVEAALNTLDIVPNIAMSLGSTEAIKRAVARGLGVGLVSRLTVGLELSSGDLQTIEVSELRIVRSLHLVWSKHQTHSPLTKEFIRVLRLRTPSKL